MRDPRVESEPGAARCCPTWWVAVPERLQKNSLSPRLSCFWSLARGLGTDDWSAGRAGAMQRRLVVVVEGISQGNGGLDL